MRIEEGEYIEPESINEDIINAINTVKEYCSAHEEYEDCRRCVLGEDDSIDSDDLDRYYYLGELIEKGLI